jgi:uncharacterized protein YjaG (DUF416 family)
MKDDWNLSEEREKLRKEIQKQMPELTMFIGFLFRDIEKQDVEFVRRLKAEMRQIALDNFSDMDQDLIQDLLKKGIYAKIDKLAGDKLNEAEK